MENEITQEELDQYLALSQKIQNLEKSIFDEEQKKNAEFLQQTQNSGVVPYQLQINVTTDVYAVQSDPHIAPVLSERMNQIYIIDFLDKSYTPIVDSIYNNMTELLQKSCADIKNQKNNTEDEVSV